MALQKDYIHESGLLADGCYFRAEHLQGTKVIMTLTVRGYATLENYTNWTNPLYFKAFEFIPSVEAGSDNFIQQAYEFLKTLPEFAGATDI